MPISLQEYAKRYAEGLQNSYDELKDSYERLSATYTTLEENNNVLLNENISLKNQLAAAQVKPNQAPGVERSVATVAEPEAIAPATKEKTDAKKSKPTDKVKTK